MPFETPLFEVAYCAFSANLRPTLEQIPVIRNHGRLRQLSDWGVLSDLAATSGTPGIVFLNLATAPAGFSGVRKSGAFARRLARPPGWYVVGISGVDALDPFTIFSITQWGMDDLLTWEQASDPGVIGRIVIASVTRGWSLRLEGALFDLVSSEDFLAVQKVFCAAEECLTRGEWSAPAMARQLFRSGSALERDMKSIGLITPGKFIRRLRLGLAVLPRRSLGPNTTLARLWGFYSTGDLSNQLKRNFGSSISWFVKASEREALARVAFALRDRGVGGIGTRRPQTSGGPGRK
jgi:AraC-like DNA-binding protein